MTRRDVAGIVALAAVALIAFAMPVLTAAPASAKPIKVNSDGDTPANDGTCTLREAITSALTGQPSGGMAGECPAGKGKTVKISFDEDSLSLPATIDIGSQLPLITGNVNIVGPGAADLTIDAGGGSFRILSVDGGELTISGVRLRGGKPASAGGAIDVFNSGVLTVTDAVLENNNTTTGTFGGAISVADATATINRSTFIDNSAPNGGGAISNIRGILLVTYSTFFNNAADFGGAINNFARTVVSTADLTVYHSIFSGNTAGLDGGAIDNFANVAGATATATITESTIVDNDATSEGGGVNNEASAGTATTTITDSIVAGNTDGGGPNDINNNEAAADLSVTNTVFDVCTGAGCP